MHWQDRPPTKPASPTYKESGHLSRTRIDERQQEISDREAERLAEKIVAVSRQGGLTSALAIAAASHSGCLVSLVSGAAVPSAMPQAPLQH